MHAELQQEGSGMMWWRLALTLVCGLALIAGGLALAQTGGNVAPGGSVAKPAAPAKPQGEPAKQPEMTVAGNFGQWALVCGKDTKEPCSLVQALVQRESNKLVFRVTVAYGPKGNLVLRIDGPTGVALQKDLEFSPDAVKVYRMPYQACVPQQCSAVLLVPDDLKQELAKSQKGTITVYALNGQALQAVAQLTGFSDGLAALDKRQPKQ
jgi:invasion protein IalB